MATNTYVPFRLPEAGVLADLTGIEIDLRSARTYAERIVKLYEEANYDLVDALSIAALITYCRSFVAGVRKPLRQDIISKLTPEQQSYHQYLRDIRDKHIAHSVNAFEESQPIARYWVERVSIEGITSIGCQHHRVVGISAQDALMVIELTTRIIGHVERLIEEEKAKLLEIVRSLPLKKVLDGDRSPPALPTDFRAARTPRKSS